MADASASRHANTWMSIDEVLAVTGLSAGGGVRGKRGGGGPGFGLCGERGGGPGGPLAVFWARAARACEEARPAVMEDRLATLRNFVRMGQVAQAEIDELLRRSGEPPAVHHLHHGVTACAMPGMPVDWPAGHRWSGEWPEVTC